MTTLLPDAPAPLIDGEKLVFLLEDITRLGVRLASSPVIDEQIVTEVTDFAQRLHPAAPNQAFAGDPGLATAVYAGSLRATGALRNPDERVARRELRLALEQVRQALRDIVDDEPAGEERNIHEVLAWLNATLAVTQPDLADLLGVSARTLTRWFSGEADPGPDPALRIRRLAALTNQLRHVLTGPGVARWLTRPAGPRRERPADLLDDADGYRALLSRARTMRTLPAG